MLRPDPG